MNKPAVNDDMNESESMAEQTDPPNSINTSVPGDLELQDSLESVEGVEDDGELGEFPIDTLLIRDERRTVFEVVRRIRQGGYIMNPDFQRDFVWDRDKQSKLIESVLMRIPLPVFYLAENEDGNVIVVDGLQRLTTFQQFLDNEFALKLPEQSLLHQMRFEELSPKLQNRIEDCSLILYILDSDVPDNAKFQIFERVNGGVPLTRQQMRNCLYNGQATEWLKAESETELFLDATGGSLKTKTMRDREFVNRFCAFWLVGKESYERADMDGFLAKALNKMNKMSTAELEGFSSHFQRTLRNNLFLFGKHAFRKHLPDTVNRSVINASMWDVMSVILGQYDEEQVKQSPDLFREAFYALLDQPEFVDAITYSVNGNNKVNRRFDMAYQKFTEVAGAFTAFA